MSEIMDLKDLPNMLYSDSKGRVYDHHYYRMAGFSGTSPISISDGDLIRMPEFSKLFYIPECPPIGLNPDKGNYEIVPEIIVDGIRTQCFAVAAFLEPGFVRSHLPAADYSAKSYTLPMWGYTAVGFRDNDYIATGFRIEYNNRWDPRNYDDRDLLPAIDEFNRSQGQGPLVEHLMHCATKNHCFAAKNLFLGRWEAPLPVSRGCNANCIGCLSLQPDPACESSHQRISFRPTRDEIVSLAVNHLKNAEDAIVSFGQGCEGEPLTEYGLIADSVREIRKITSRGTINLNTNGSKPERIKLIAESGLDSIRISMNSARQEFYDAYYRPNDYTFDDVVESISLSRRLDLYTMINYLVFPGITDQEEEIDALRHLIQETGINFLHLKNLNIDPQLYLENMPLLDSKTVGMKNMMSILENEFDDLKLGYFNQTSPPG